MSSTDMQMDDLINLINNTTPPKSKTPITKPPISTPIRNTDSNPSDHDITSDEDDDISYLLDVINKKPASINGITPSTTNALSNPKQHNINTSSPSNPPNNLNTPPMTSLDDLMTILSPSKRTEPPSAPTIATEESTPSPPPSPPSNIISINIRILTGDTMHYEMQRQDSIKCLKNKIFADHKIIPEHQRLIYGGDNLRDKHSLQMLGIQNEAILYMVLHTVCSNTEPPKTIAVQKLNGDIFYISCTSNDTVQTLKRTIQNQEGYDIESQILCFTHYGRLENDKTLKHYNIQNNSMLKMMLRNIRFDNYKDEEDEEDQQQVETQAILLPFCAQNGPKPPIQPPAVPHNVPIQPVVPPTIPPVPSVPTVPHTASIPLQPPNIPPQPPVPPVVPTQPTPPTTHPTQPTVPPIVSTQSIIPPNHSTQPIISPNDAKHPLEPTKDDKQSIPSDVDVPPEAKATVAGAEDIAALSPTHHHNTESKKGYNGWNIGDICYRKNEKCVIKSIHHLSNPPSVTIAIFNDETHEINTEFHLISAKPPEPKPKPKPKAKPKPSVPMTHNNNKAVMNTKPTQIHLCNPNIIRQLMAVNNIKYIGSGLKNLGNSCFMNATLQCLTYTQVFQNYIYQKIHTKMCNLSKRREVCFMCELHDLLPQMINNGGYVLTPGRLFNSLQYLSRSLVPGRQEDSHEFWTALVKQLQAAVMRPHVVANNGKKLPIAVQETSIIYKIWGGYLRSQIMCTACHKGSNTYDSILDLSLEIRGCNSITSALKKFTVQEKLMDDNKYFCGFCKKKQNAIKQLTIFDAPNILILHLKRFEFGTKIDKFVQFDTTLDLTPFMSECRKMKQKGVKITYSLYAVLIHAGKYSNCGHYYSYINTANHKWYLCNDASIRSATQSNVLKQNGYLFFYKRNQQKRYR